MSGEGRRSIPEEEMSIDEHVWVQLTQNGKKTYEEFCRKSLTEPPRLWADRRGWCSLPLRELGQIFGPMLGKDSPTQFINNVIRLSRPG